MDFTNEFRVNLPPDGAWDLLTDIERVAPCMPGAQLTGVTGDAYNGVVKVKVGPMTVQYKGVVSFEEKDEAGRTAVLHARGRDTRGQGNADARVTARLVPDGDGDGDGAGTRVTVDTRLTITGRIAQFGRGMIEEVSGRLLAQFVDNLEGQLAAERRRGRDPEHAGEPPARVPTPPPTPTPGPAVPASGAPTPTPPVQAAADSAAVPDTGSGAAPDTGPDTGADTGSEASAPAAAAAAAASSGPREDTSAAGATQETTPASPGAPAAAQPLDLMSVARGALLKRALPAALVLAVIVIGLVVWLTR
ncbi:SRPBCC family protein [Streptomyces sp. NPDC048484]|uniref:SRPBCC family protein n=1 Tax=Streptomyces sp. NPDC048484 TaxID=3155146 RepID=UPI00341DE1D0